MDVNAAFAGLRKPKKKVVLVTSEEKEECSDTKVADEVADPFAGLKKKKKDKKEFVPEAGSVQGGDSATGEQQAQVESTDPFAGLKKKKKDKKIDDFEKGLINDDADMHGDVVFGEEEGGLPEMEVAGEDAWVGSTRDYTYGELLARVFKTLRQSNPELQGEKKRYTIAPPQVLREGTKKTVFANIVDISKHMRRLPDHLIQFLFAELGTSGSIDGASRLVIKGRFQQKQIENVLKRYIVEYVTCKTCKSAETALTKENRLFFMQCESCGSSRSVSAIKTGFQAQTGKRVKPAAT